MSALAGLFAESGWLVEGSDIMYHPPASQLFKRIRAKLHRGYDPANVPEADVYIAGNSVNKDNPEVKKAMEIGEVLSLPEALNRFFVKDRKVILITGTHGKTTITGGIWWVLKECGLSSGLFVGGVMRNTGKSYSHGNDFFVIEGDEYSTSFNDRRAKFLHYKADILLINSLEYDHADVYRDIEELEYTFSKLIKNNASAKIFASSEWNSIHKLLAKENVNPIWYGKGKPSEVVPNSKGSIFSFLTQRGRIEFENHHLFGRHMASNLAGIIAVGMYLGIPLDRIKTALAKYKGIVRREEIILINNRIVVIDDFAHHPTEVRETLLSVKERFNNRVIAIFEPRTNTSRRNIFFSEYVNALSVADCVYLLPLYREDMVKGDRLPVSKLRNELEKKGKTAHLLSGYTEVEPLIKESDSGGTFVFMSAGDMEGMPHIFANRIKK